MHHRPVGFGTIALLAVFLVGDANAQPRYQGPSPAVVRILDAPPAPQVIISPDRSKLMMLEPEGLPARMMTDQPEIWLAGIRINPRNNAPSHIATYTALIARPIGRGETRRIVIPWKARVANPIWSPNGERIAFSVVEESGISLWMAEPGSGESRMLLGPVLNGALGNPCQWLPDSDGLLCLKAVNNRPGARVLSPAATAAERAESENAGTIEQYFTSQMAVISKSGTERPIGAPGIFSRVELSPDGRYLLVESLHRPFSSKSSSGNFPTRTELWDVAGTPLKLLGDRGQQAGRAQSADQVPDGPRSFQWRNDAPATLVWVEALDGGTPSAPATIRDRMLQLDAPFSGTPSTLLDSQGRIQEAVWGRSDVAIVTESWVATGQARTWVIDPSQVGGAPKLISERSMEDRFADPGRFILSRGRSGRMVLHTSNDGRFAFVTGVSTSLAGDRPFLDRLELPTRKWFRLWRAEGAGYEQVVALLDQEGSRGITLRESAIEPPNYFIRDLTKTGAKRFSALTEFKDTSPEFSGISRQLLSFKRRDGVTLSATLYLPAFYRAAQRPLPFVLWANPREFRSARAASQVAGSPFRFARPSELPWLYFLLNGYGVLDISGPPIISESGSASSDRYREQLVAGATAAVGKLVAMGMADPKRIGIGGDSAGGSAAVTLLAHSNLFRAGIAEAKQEDDSSTTTVLFKPADSGTRPLLTLLPWGGGVRTRESVGRRYTEMLDWMDRYVKGAGVGGRP